jgi:hypothetical protein
MSHRQYFRFGLLLACALFALQTGNLRAAVTNTNALVTGTNSPAINTNAFKSVFDSKGRDPFLPRSNRQSLEPSENGDSAPTIILVLKGISGSVNRKFAIINDRTFGSGEEAEVVTAGGRIRIRCQEILTDRAIVTIGNNPEKIELRLPTRF